MGLGLLRRTRKSLGATGSLLAVPHSKSGGNRARGGASRDCGTVYAISTFNYVAKQFTRCMITLPLSSKLPLCKTDGTITSSRPDLFFFTNIHRFLWDVITHPYPNINGAVSIKPLLKLWYGCVIITHCSMRM